VPDLSRAREDGSMKEAMIVRFNKPGFAILTPTQITFVEDNKVTRKISPKVGIQHCGGQRIRHIWYEEESTVEEKT